MDRITKLVRAANGLADYCTKRGVASFSLDGLLLQIVSMAIRERKGEPEPSELPRSESFHIIDAGQGRYYILRGRFDGNWYGETDASRNEEERDRDEWL